MAGRRVKPTVLALTAIASATLQTQLYIAVAWQNWQGAWPSRTSMGPLPRGAKTAGSVGPKKTIDSP